MSPNHGFVICSAGLLSRFGKLVDMISKVIIQYSLIYLFIMANMAKQHEAYGKILLFRLRLFATIGIMIMTIFGIARLVSKDIFV